MSRHWFTSRHNGAQSQYGKPQETKQSALRAALRPILRVISRSKGNKKRRPTKKFDALATSQSTSLSPSEPSEASAGTKLPEAPEYSPDDSPIPQSRSLRVSRCRHRQNHRTRASLTRLAPPFFTECEADDDLLIASRETADANATFFSTPAVATNSNEVRTTSWHSSSPVVSNTSSVEIVLLEQVRNREENARVLRHCNNGQQQELIRLRSLISIYMNRRKSAEEAVGQWKATNDRSLALAEQWRDEAEARKADISVLRTQLSAARCGDEVARGAYETIEKESTLQRQTQVQAEALQEVHQILQDEHGRLKAILSELQCDYEVLVNHKTAEWVADPEYKDAGSIKPNETRDLHQALEQSMRNHKAEIALCNETRKITQEQQSEIEKLKEEKEQLHQRNEDLQKLDAARTIVEDHQAAVKYLFTAAAMFASDSAVAQVIEDLVKELSTEKVSTEMLGSLMQQNAELKAKQLRTEHEHREAVRSKQAELEQINTNYLKLETTQIEATVRLPEAESELETANQNIAILVEDRDEWRRQCERKAFGEHDEVMYRSVRQRGDMYRNKHAESERRCDLLESDMTNIRGWAAEELDNTGMYMEQRDWYESQVKALEAECADELRNMQVKMPFRPNFRAATEEQKLEMLGDGAKPGEHSQDSRGAKYNRVRNTYLEKEPSDVTVLVERVAELRTQVARHQCEAVTPTVEERRENPQKWAAVMPQLPAGLLEAQAGDVEDNVDDWGHSIGSWVTEAGEMDEGLSFSIF